MSLPAMTFGDRFGF